MWSSPSRCQFGAWGIPHGRCEGHRVLDLLETFEHVREILEAQVGLGGYVTAAEFTGRRVQRNLTRTENPSVTDDRL